MGSPQTLKPEGLIKIPKNYPSYPNPNKLRLLWDSNAERLTSKLSPYTDYDTSLLNKLIGDKEPFQYIYPKDSNKGLNRFKKYESRIFPLGSASQDVVRMAKFLASGRGVGFLAKQFLLQTGNAYNETRIYNPTEILVAAGKSLTAGMVSPARHFDTSAGLAGIAGSVLGGKVQNAIFGKSIVNPPSGTTGRAALPSINENTDGKGLLRAQTANTAKGLMDGKWATPPKSGGFFKSLFANFIPAKQDGIVYKSDEGMYGLMIDDLKANLSYTDRKGVQKNQTQLWVGGSKTLRKNGEYSYDAGRYFVGPNGDLIHFTKKKLNTPFSDIADIVVGYYVQESSDSTSPGFRYGDVLGNESIYDRSDMMIQYKLYSEPKDASNPQYKSKKTDPSSILSRREELEKILKNIDDASGGIYSINLPETSRIINKEKPGEEGFDKLYNTKKIGDNKSGLNYNLGVLKEYRDASVRLTDNNISINQNYSLRLPSSGKFDAINVLTVLDKKRVNSYDMYGKEYRGWETSRWDPYIHDQIAFYFYDIVNEKYIPFRCTVNGINESSNATWDEISFMGRADRIYSYNGFSRDLSFKIKIVIGSIAELAPTWQRINYMMTSCKPSNYTTDGKTDRFMVPPMFMVTIGDLYKEQPIIIQSVGMQIPEDASWETMNENNSENWTYLAKYIKSTDTAITYGQLPREIELSFSLKLLEKERPVAGGANFGHAPRNDDYIFYNTDTQPNQEPPTELHKSLVVDNIYHRNGIDIPTKDETLSSPTQDSPLEIEKQLEIARLRENYENLTLRANASSLTNLTPSVF